VIGQRELESRAAKLGISTQHAEVDYALSHILAAIAEDAQDLVFRGGTALESC
jgi:predicted nucleotidyltransferase component of viral defense system